MYGAESSQNAPAGFVFLADKLKEVKNVLNGDNKTDEYGESIDSRSKQPKNVANFCSVCGTKCVSGASFCFDCGASLHTKPRQNNKNNHSNHSKVLVIINFAFNVCLALYTCFVFLAVALLKITVYVSHNVSLQYSSFRKEYYISNTGPSTRINIYFDVTFVILATIIAVAILTLAVISFILELKKHNNSDEKFWTSILRLVVSAVVTTTTIFLLCCNNCVI